MAQNQYYTIRVGTTKPQLVEMGEINKTTGMPMGPTEKAESVVGKITIPNYSKIYAIVERDKHGKMTGKFEAVKWASHEKGEVVEIRYASNSPSLLKLWQEEKKINFNEQEAEITLLYGLNYIDEKREPMKVQMLKLHTYNGSNVSRDPENKHVIFNEYDPSKEDQADLKKFQGLAEAMSFLHTIQDDPRRLRVMAIAFGVDEQLPNDKIILKLMQRAHQDPQAFLQMRDDHYAKVQAILFRAHDLMVIQLDDANAITMGEDRTLVFGGFTKIHGTARLEFMVENAFEPDCGEAIEKISRALAMREAQFV